MSIPTRRRTVRRGAVAAAAATGLALVLAGCVGAPAATPTPSPAGTPAPIFASDEEALAAATEAYEAYSSTINAIARDGNQEAERIRAVVTEEYAPDVESLFSDLATRGLSIRGDSHVDSIRLVEFATVDDAAEVTILLCSDVTESRIVDAAGNDVTPATRPNRSALQAVLVSSLNDPAALLVDKEDPWSGDYC